MRILDIIQEATGPQIYSIGDSHAVAIATSGKFINLAKNGRSASDSANDAAINQVAPGSTVVLSAGANDMLSPNKQQIVSRVTSLISKLQQKKCKVFYILFAETDSPKYAKDRNQLRQLVKASLPGDIEVIDMGKLSVANGDGIHAPMTWYANASRQVRSGATQVQAPQPANSAQKVEPSVANMKPGEDNMAHAAATQSLSVPGGNVNPEVADLQKVLLALGYKLPKHGVDGVRGPETRNAVKQFQKDNGLEVDGDPGPETIGAMNRLIVSKKVAFVKSTQADVKGKFVSATDPQDVGDIMSDSDPSVIEGRKSAESYLGRKMSDEEWTALMKVTAAEESDTRAMTWVMAAILNRTNRGTWGNSVVSVVSAPYQFEPVTGASGKEKRLHTLPIPSGRKLKAILAGAKEILPSVPKKIVNFTSNIDAAYKGRASISYKHKLLARGGEVVGNSIFAA
jgi:phenylpyruvate tautomerase PptA (4-oxalocrotonate tautomerase family)